MVESSSRPLSPSDKKTYQSLNYSSTSVDSCRAILNQPTNETQSPREMTFYEKIRVTSIMLFLGFIIILVARIYILPEILHWNDSDIIKDSPTRQVQGIKGGVAAEHEYCSNIGTEILQKGGVAVDAAIAGALCVGVVNGFSSGIGGGGFMLIRTADSEVEVIDFREVAPEKTNPDDYTRFPDATQITGLSIGVPGELRGFELAHKRHGKLPWKELFLPSIELARDGFSVGFELAKHIRDESKAILASKTMSEVYAANGKLATIGDKIYRPTLAKTLEIIAEQGPQAFYEGEIADNTIETIKSRGGVMTKQDLLRYEPIIRKPLIGEFEGSKVYTTPAPTSGAILLAILNTMEGYSNFRDPVLQNHRLVEAFKYGFALRTELADPLFANITTRVSEISTKGFADQIRLNISDTQTFQYQHYNPKFATKELPGTTHLSTISSDSQAVALTSTVNLIFGSKIMDPKTGILFNNQMDDFSIPHVKNGFDLYPSPANFIAPRKRPLSSTVPTIVETQSEQGVALMVIGGSGGSRILSAVSQVLLHSKSMSLEAAVDYPRFHHQLLPNTIYFEPDVNPFLEKSLNRFGHEITWWKNTKSAVQAVHRDFDGRITAASDGRKHGLASAY